MAGLVELEISYQRLVAQRDALRKRYEAGEKNLLPEIQSINSQIGAVLTQIENLRAVNSSGTVVQDDQAAKVDRSNTQSPNTPIEYLQNGRIKPPSDTSTSSNAIIFNPQSADAGTNGRLRNTVETQGTPPGASQTSPGARVDNDAPVSAGGAIDRGINPVTGNPRMEFTGMNSTPGGDPGVGAASDDNTQLGSAGEVGQSGNATVAELNLVDYGKVIPRSNVLDQYASYNYQASLYLFPRAEYVVQVESNQRNLAGAQLLIQTGGASPVGRSEYFSLDYYIDKIELTSLIAGKGTGLAHNVQTVKMTVVEPNGISFIQNLDKAAEKLAGSKAAKKETFTQQIYLLVIRFYGYDDQGNLIRGGINKPDQTSDPNAFIEKWYPLVFSDVKFKIASKAVEYEITATAVAYHYGASTKYATIPFNIELSGQTLKDILAGPAIYATGQAAVSSGTNANPAGATPVFANTGGGAAVGARLNVGRRNTNTATVVTATPPPNANAANTSLLTVRSGLMSALNDYQNKLVARGVIEIADEYEVEFLLDSLAQAKITIEGGLDKSATSMSRPGTAADQKLGSKQSMNPNSRIAGSVAGMQIVQYIDLLIRNSTYIRNQQVLEIKDNNKKPVSTGVKTTNTSWYKIGFQATPKLAEGIDKKRNSYAWKIKYTIAPYKLSQLNSPYFNVPLPTGTHKQYRYWFTGQNDSVLSYEETLNNLYFVVLSGADLTNRSANNADYLQYHYQTASGQATTGATGKTNEPGANAADQLYSPADLQDCNMTIVGDPAWLQQGEASLGLAKNDPYLFRPFLADGTINFDSQQILFEVGFNTPQDYNIDSGLIEPKWGNLDTNVAKYYSTIQPGLAQITRTYYAKELTSFFNKGKFTQEIKGSIMPYVNKLEIAQIAAAAAPTTTAAVAGPVNTTTPAWATSVTGQTPTSSVAKGVVQILTPATQLDNPTLTQLQSSPVYIQAVRNGATAPVALAAARAAFAAGTNNYSGSALPGIRFPGQPIVKDQ